MAKVLNGDSSVGKYPLINLNKQSDLGGSGQAEAGYSSDSSLRDDVTHRRGRKRKEMCPDEEEEKRVTANLQERQRMMKLNTALDRLRHCLPEHFKLGNRRISKIRTLRLAASYIKSLGDILKEDLIIRESMPPQPGFDLRLPTLADVHRQGDGGEMYTPEKELGPEALAVPTPDYRYMLYSHAHSSSSPPFLCSSTPSAPGHPVYPTHLQQYPQHLYPAQFYHPAYQTLTHPSEGGAVVYHV